MYGNLFNFLQLWEKKYDFFILERLLCEIPSKTNKGEIDYYCCVYCYPIPKSMKYSEKIGDLVISDNFRFSRLKMDIEVFKAFLKQILTAEEDNISSYTFSDNAEMDTKLLEKNYKEIIVRLDWSKLIGKASPNYRFIKSLMSSLPEEEFTTVSNVGYSKLHTAVIDIFNLPSNIFSKENYEGIYNSLVVDLSHFSWRIKDFKLFKNQAEVKIENMNNNSEEFPEGVAIGKFLDRRVQKLNVRFDDKMQKKLVFDRALASCDFYLLSKSKIGFGGYWDKPSKGRILDFRSERKYISYSFQEKLHSLEAIESEDLLRLIEDGESEIIEFKEQNNELPLGFNIERIAKQLMGMVNNKIPGMIILGVSDYGEINGVKKISLQRIIDGLQDHFDSKWSSKVEVIGNVYHPIKEKPNLKIYTILAITQEEKLYSTVIDKNKIYFPLRRGATTRCMKNSEIEEFYKS